MKHQLNEIKRMQQLAGILKEGQLNENQLIGTIFSPVEDEIGMIEYEWNEPNVINVIKGMGYNDPEEIANEILTISSPDDFLKMMRNKTGNKDLDITDLTLDMFKQSIEDEFKM
jgi:hypothetical protein